MSEEFVPSDLQRHRDRTAELIQDQHDLLLSVRAALVALDLAPLPDPVRELVTAACLHLDRTTGLAGYLDLRLENVERDADHRVGDLEDLVDGLRRRLEAVETRLAADGST